MVSSDHPDGFPCLACLINAYLNQDHDLNGPSLEDSVFAYMRDSDDLDVAAARGDVRRFLTFKADDVDAELDRLFFDRAQEPSQSGAEYLRRVDRLLARPRPDG